MTDAEDEWIVINGMGGYVCAECGMPVESEPCEAHQPTKYARAHGTLRVPVSMFERVDGCFACENRTGLPIPVSEFPEGGDIGLCMRHWNWWITHFANIAPDHETPEPPCSARLLESEIARERAALRPGSADPVHPPMPVGHIRACGCPECVAWLEAHEPAERCSMCRDGVSHSARCHHDEHEVCDRVAEGTDAPKSCACPCHSPGEPSPCAGCGGDGVQIDDDPESTRQIVSTCGECRGSGSEGRGSDDA